MADQLAAGQMATFEPSPDHVRSPLLVLTSRGAEILDQLNQAADRRNQQTGQQLGDDASRRLRDPAQPARAGPAPRPTPRPPGRHPLSHGPLARPRRTTPERNSHDRVFFDESHEILQLMDITQPAPDTVSARTRLRFFLRRREPGSAVSEEFTGQAFHTWRLRREPADSRWRVAAQIFDGFAVLNDNAAALFAAPAKGLRT